MLDTMIYVDVAGTNNVGIHNTSEISCGSVTSSVGNTTNCVGINNYGNINYYVSFKRMALINHKM